MNKYLKITIGTAILILTSVFIKDFKIDASSTTLLSGGNKIFYETLKANQTFGVKNTTLIAFKPKSGRIFSEETLNIVNEFSKELRKIERVKSISSILETPLFFNLKSYNTDISNNTIKQSDFSEQELKKNLKNHPIYTNTYFDKNLTTLSILVEFQGSKKLDEINEKILPLEKKTIQDELTSKDEEKIERLKKQKFIEQSALTQKTNKAIDKIRNLVQDYKSKGEFYLGGGSTVGYQLVKLIQNDLFVFGIAIFVLMGIYIFSVYRETAITILPLLTCLISVFQTIGLLGLLEMPVTVISANVISLQVILTLIVTIHLTESLRENLDKSKGENRAKIISLATKEKFKPCLYAGITTLIGFGSLITSDIKPIRSFGMMMCLVILMSIYAGLFVYPLLLELFFKKKTIEIKPKYFHTWKEFFIDSSLKREKLVFIASTILVLGGIAGASTLSTDQSFLNYFSDSTKVKKELTFIDKNMGGTTPIDIIYDIPKSEQKTDLLITGMTVKKIKGLQEELERNPYISGVTSFIDFLRVAKNVRDMPLTEYELTALYNTLPEKTKNEILKQFFSSEEKSIRISGRVIDSSPDLKRSDLNKNIDGFLDKHQLKKENVKKTNLFFIYENILRRLVDTQIISMITVYLAMFLFLASVFKSFKISIICLLPNIVSTFCIFIFMAIFQIHLDIMTITIASVVMGISVDDTVHYAHNFLSLSDENSERVKKVSRSLGNALIFTSMVIAAGFAALAFSDFVPARIFGLLTAMGMLIALVVDLTLLPALLAKYKN